MTGDLIDLIRANAALLVIAVPFLGAALVIVGAPARVSWIAAVSATVIAAAIAVDLAVRTLSGGVVRIDALGSDGAGVFGAALVASLSALTLCAFGGWLRDFEPRVAPLALALALCIGGGWSGALLAQDWVALFVAVEIAWLAAIGLVALNAARERGALNGALRMLSVGGVASAFLLLGIGLIGRADGSVVLAALPSANIASPALASLGVGLVFVSLAMKAGIAPFHAWAGATFGRGGPSTLLCVGVVSIVGALAVFARVTAYAIPAPELGAGLSLALAVIGAASAVIGSVQAMGAQSLPRLAAYACAAQAGCILLSLALGSPAAFAAALVQIVSLAAAALALFGGAAAGRVGALSMLDGYGRRAPLASAAITAGALSLMGAPLTLGFLGRWRLVEAGVGAGWWWSSLIVIVVSLAAVFYGGRLVERIYFRRAGETFDGDQRRPNWMLAPALLAAIATIGIGFAPGVLLRAAAAASAMLSGGAP